MTPSGERIVQRATWGVVWAFTATAGGRLLSLLSMAVLARLLTPQQFGIVAFALVFIAYLETVGDLGTGMALIYWPDRRHDAAQVTFWLNLLTGSAWFALAYAMAPAVAAFFHQPEGTAVLRALSVTFLIKAFGNTHDALSRKDLTFKARLLPEIGLTAVKALVAIVLAVQGFGVWSLVWGQIAGLSLWTVGMWWIAPWRPRLAFPLDLVKQMMRYGRGIVAVNIIASIVHRADVVIVGRMLGASTLGFYHIATKLTDMAIQLPVWAASKVAFPAFARFRDRDTLDRAYLVTLRFVSLATVPAGVGLVLLAHPTVHVLLGTEWTPSAPILQGLVVYACLKSLGTHSGDVLKSIGRPRLLAGLGMARGLVLVPAVVVAGGVSAPAVALTMALVTAPFAAINVGVACRLIGVRPGAVVRALAPALLAVLPMMLGLLAYRALLDPLDDVVSLAGAVAAGVALYLSALGLISPGVFRQAHRGLVAPPVASELGSPLPESRS